MANMPVSFQFLCLLPNYLFGSLVSSLDFINFYAFKCSLFFLVPTNYCLFQCLRRAKGLSLLIGHLKYPFTCLLHLIVIHVHLIIGWGCMQTSETSIGSASSSNIQTTPSMIWICTTLRGASHVTVADGNNLSVPLEEFRVSSSHILCMTGVPGTSFFTLFDRYLVHIARNRR